MSPPLDTLNAPALLALPTGLARFAGAVGQRLLPWLVPVALIAVWQAASAYGWLSTRVLPRRWMCCAPPGRWPNRASCGPM